MTTTEQHPFIRLLGGVCYITVLFYLFHLFFPSDMIILISSILAAILLGSTLFFVSTFSRIIVIILVTVGGFCFYVEGTPLDDALLGFGRNINLLSLFLLIPLIGTFMSIAGYLSLLKEQVQKRQKEGGASHPYRLSFLLTILIGVLLNFGSMPIVKKIVEGSFSSYQDQKLTLTIMRAFGFCIFWSPYFVNVGIVLVLFDLSWFEIGGYGFAMGLVYIVVCLLMFKQISFPNDPIIEKELQFDESVDSGRSLMPLFSFSLVLIVLSFSLDILLEVNMLTIVCVLALVLPFFWAIIAKSLSDYLLAVSEQVQSSFFRLKNEIAVFISAGFFSVAIAETEIGAYGSAFLYEASFGSVFILSYLLIAFAILLAQIGVHPVIIVSGIGSTLTPSTFGVSSEYLALVMIIAWALATQLSPFSGQVLMASRLINKSTGVIVKQNVRFIAILSILLTAIVYCFHLFGWV
ncbi:hypothetical protein [Halalkalibacterium ligniniphilum]|uniref:hypothetical protein n=1 Tax=Halalkalibacterium ligniniphilum TaxID=1134413 RepID=UPI001F388109|nr:hypothetical protein [Halalkalibacterium ligniniphilum]